FQAGSVEMYYPQTSYAYSKLFAYNLVKLYRNEYGLFACNSILYNHESELRGREFVTRKISMAVAAIMDGSKAKLELDNISGEIDWGYAPEYVQGFHKMMQLESASDWAFKTGKINTVEDFLEAAFSYKNLQWKEYVSFKSNKNVVDTISLPEYAPVLAGWKPKTTMKEIARIMVDADMKRLRV
ncbi:MAG: GDP-mannose 4,6-dehydratase, partial [Candidatus Micrarchaeota archaeon]|nr:GDP-mannose 4,6-dehydratase [Candidatus Micrarchaeota archaeon]